MSNLKPTCHRDGTVTIWSVYQQVWTRTPNVEDRELAAMDRTDRARVIRHQARHQAHD